MYATVLPSGESCGGAPAIRCSDARSISVIGFAADGACAWTGVDAGSVSTAAATIRLRRLIKNRMLKRQNSTLWTLLALRGCRFHVFLRLLARRPLGCERPIRGVFLEPLDLGVQLGQLMPQLAPAVRFPRRHIQVRRD